MRDVIVLCEGHTEREFCRSVVAPQLATSDVTLAGTLVGKPQRKQGGIRDWIVYRNELLRLAKERDGRHVAVLVDYYRMPNSWPGRTAASAKPAKLRGVHVEESLIEDLREELNGLFHPCVQLHEFESLIFVAPDISALSIAIGSGSTDHERVARQLQAIREEYGGEVELIDDSPETAPSKRIAKIVSGYDKVAWGVTAAADIGLPSLRSGCPWLDRWIVRLESV